PDAPRRALRMRPSGAGRLLPRLSRLVRGEEVAHALQRLQDVLRGVGVGEADEALAVDAEVRPADDGDARLLEKGGGERLGLPARARDVREGVEGALGRGAGDAGQLVEPLYDDFPPSVELGHHLAHAVLRAGEGGETGPLGGGVDAG